MRPPTEGDVMKASALLGLVLVAAAGALVLGILLYRLPGP